MKVITGTQSFRRVLVNALARLRARRLNAKHVSVVAYFDHGVARRCTGEYKVEFVQWSSKIQMQIDKDAVLIVASDKKFTGAEWHLFVSGNTGMVGVDQKVLDYLTGKGIPYVIRVG